MEKILETIRKNADVINDILWYVNPKNIEQSLIDYRDEIKMLIVKETNIARQEGEKTSRLTSLYNLIK